MGFPEALQGASFESAAPPPSPFLDIIGWAELMGLLLVLGLRKQVSSKKKGEREKMRIIVKRLNGVERR